MELLNRFQSLVIASAVLLGLVLGRVDVVKEASGYLITPLLMVMLFGLFLSIPLKDLVGALSNRSFFLISIGINFILTPLVAYLLGYMFLKEEPAFWIGFVMLLVTPCTDWYLAFTAMAGGNLPLSTSILPLNLILQIFLLPVYLQLFFAKTGFVDLSVVLKGIFTVVVLPMFLAQIVRYKGIVSKFSFFERSQIIFLSLAIVCMFASQGNALRGNYFLVFSLLPPLMLFFLFAYFSGVFLGRLFLRNYRDTASLVLTLMARNSPVALAIALTAFDEEPLIALSLVIGPLIELPVLFIASRTLLLSRRLGVL